MDRRLGSESGVTYKCVLLKLGRSWIPTSCRVWQGTVQLSEAEGNTRTWVKVLDLLSTKRR